MFHVGSKITIRGEHETEPTPRGRVGVSLVPQRGPRFAFGNGYKRSTRIFLSELELFIPPRASSILDIGTGVGVLAIAAKKLNPLATITAIEPLDVGMTLARRNFALNEVRIDLLNGWYPDNFPNLGPFDLVLANLDTLEPIAASMNRRLAPTILTMPKTRDMDVVNRIASMRGYQIQKQISDHGEYEFIVLGLA